MLNHNHPSMPTTHKSNVQKKHLTCHHENQLPTLRPLHQPQLVLVQFPPLPASECMMVCYEPLNDSLMLFLTIPCNTIPNGATTLLCHLDLAFDDDIAASKGASPLFEYNLIYLWNCNVTCAPDYKTLFHFGVKLTPHLQHNHHPCSTRSLPSSSAKPSISLSGSPMVSPSITVTPSTTGFAKIRVSPPEPISTTFGLP